MFGTNGAELTHAARKGEDHAGDEPGRVSGRVITRKTQTGPAPRRAAASSSRRSTTSIDSRIARTISGKPIRAGEGRTRPTKREDDAEMLVEELADGTAAAEEQQQEIACHHRRHHQRQMNHPVDDRFSPEPPARQHQSHKNSWYQARRHGPEGDTQAEAHRGRFLRR